MSRRQVRARSVAVAVLACALAVVIAQPAATQESDAAWRRHFARTPMPPAPADNAMTPEKVALGAALFADPRLSGNGRRACTSCHQPSRSFSDGRRRARAISGGPLQRNTPALWNLAWGKLFFWDGRAASLEAQAQKPIEEASEIAGDWPTILARLQSDAGLVAQMRAAFPDRPHHPEQAQVLQALGVYVRSLVSPPTRFDAWVAGDDAALGARELAGFHLFVGKAQCVLCHAGWRFTDDRFHDIGLRGRDPGRSIVAGGTPGLRAFKTPSLREVAHTAPYMHDGSLPNLDAVLRHYSGTFARRPSVAPSMPRDLQLTAAERRDLIAFLATLSSGRQVKQ